MATVNFSVPDEVKEKFNKTFAGRNKSRIVAELMTRAVEEDAARKRRAKAIDSLVRRRRSRPAASASEIRRARQAGRP
jgi:hypothetical protein